MSNIIHENKLSYDIDGILNLVGTDMDWGWWRVFLFDGFNFNNKLRKVNNIYEGLLAGCGDTIHEMAPCSCRESFFHILQNTYHFSRCGYDSDQTISLYIGIIIKKDSGTDFSEIHSIVKKYRAKFSLSGIDYIDDRDSYIVIILPAKRFSLVGVFISFIYITASKAESYDKSKLTTNDVVKYLDNRKEYWSEEAIKLFFELDNSFGSVFHNYSILDSPIRGPNGFNSYFSYLSEHQYDVRNLFKKRVFNHEFNHAFAIFPNIDSMYRYFRDGEN